MGVFVGILIGLWTLLQWFCAIVVGVLVILGLTTVAENLKAKGMQQGLLTLVVVLLFLAVVIFFLQMLFAALIEPRARNRR